jgi:hypothetical protein
MSRDTKGYLVLGWLFGTLGGSVLVAGALYSGLADQPRPHAGWYLVAGVALLIAGVLSAVALAIGARTQQGRWLAMLAAGAPIVVTLLAITQ